MNRNEEAFVASRSLDVMVIAAVDPFRFRTPCLFFFIFGLLPVLQ